MAHPRPELDLDEVQVAAISAALATLQTDHGITADDVVRHLGRRKRRFTKRGGVAGADGAEEEESECEDMDTGNLNEGELEITLRYTRKEQGAGGELVSEEATAVFGAEVSWEQSGREGEGGTEGERVDEGEDEEDEDRMGGGGGETYGWHRTRGTFSTCLVHDFTSRPFVRSPASHACARSRLRSSSRRRRRTPTMRASSSMRALCQVRQQVVSSARSTA